MPRLTPQQKTGLIKAIVILLLAFGVISGADVASVPLVDAGVF